MKKFIIGALLPLIFASFAHSAILVKSPNGTVTTKTTLAAAAVAADTAGKTVVVTSALSAVMSNISSATLHKWPSDRKLIIEKGGSIGNTTKFEIDGPFEAGLSQAFSGTGRVIFNAGSTNEVRPEWWGIDGTNDEVQIQAAINAAVDARIPVKLSVRNYSVSSTITLYDGTYLVGEKGDMFPNGYGKDPKSTRITFTPATPMVLFQYAPTAGNATGQIFYTGVSGIYMQGDGTANSTAGISVKDVIYGRFSKLSIVGFQTAISNEHTVMNRFEFVYASGTVSAIEYKGLVSTTDVWDTCTFFGSPIGVQTLTTTVGIRFTGCNFEQLNYGANIVKETNNMIFDNCYSEDVPFSVGAGYAMFRVGFDGTTLVGTNNITLVGGYYKGRNAGATGSFFNSDYLYGALIDGVVASKYTNLFNTTVNTIDNVISVHGLKAGTFTNYFAGGAEAKVAGSLPVGFMTDATQGQRGYFNTIIAPTIKGNTAGTGSITMPAAGMFLGSATGYVAPGADNDVRLGAASYRWSNVFAGKVTLIDGVTAPDTIAGHGQIYIDTADGDLKIKYGDGTVKLIVTDTP